MDKLHFAVVGCGRIGRRHIDVLTAHPDVTLAAVCDVDAAAREEAVARSAGAQPATAFADYAEMLRAAPCDIVNICTPHSLHAEMAIRAAEAGKHVLVEKPMALTRADSDRMIEAASANGVRLYVVKQNRFNTPIELTRRALAEGRLGRVLMVQCSVLWNRHVDYYRRSAWRGRRALEGGALHTQVSHFIDLLVWWLGPVEEVEAFTATLLHDIEFEDCGVAVLRFERGTLGTLAWTTCVYNANYEGSITLVGETGTIKVGGRYLNRIEYWDVQSYPLPEDVVFDDRPNDYGTYYGSSSNHDLLIDALVSQFATGRRGVVEGAEGRRTIEVIERIYERARHRS